jgi:hypothetical protein
METRSATRALCADAWKEGMPLKVTADGFPILMKPSMNCEFVVKDTQDIAYVGFPDVPKEKLIPMLREFLTTIPRLTADELETPPAMQPDKERKAPDGIYTWIYASTDGSEPTFYASRTAAMLELGTVHYSIATAVGATAVHGAGEVWKHENTLTFNFLSGTFMEKWQLPEGCTLKIMEELLKQTLKQTFAYSHRAKGLAFRPLDTTFINTRFLELTTYELDGYVKAGFKVCIHPKDAKEVCKKTKATCARPVTREPTSEALAEQMKYPLSVEQMKGGNQDRPTPRTARLQGVPYVPPALPQINEARRMLTFGEATREAPTAPPRVPTSKLPGMGGRKTKTRKTKLHRRTTRRHRRGGGTAEEVAEAALRPPPPQGPLQQALARMRGPPPKLPTGQALGPSATMWSASVPTSWEVPSRLKATAPVWSPPAPDPPEVQMFDELAEELRLTPKQRAYMVGTFYDARERKIELPKDRLRKHLKTVYRL